MIRILFSVIMIVGGIALIIFSFYDTNKKQIRIVNKDNTELTKYLKYKNILNLITGFCFFVLGFISILSHLNGDTVGLLSSIILLLDKMVEFIINKKYQSIREHS